MSHDSLAVFGGLMLGKWQGEGVAGFSGLDVRVLLEALEDAVFLCDAASGNILDANPQGYRLLGSRGERGCEVRVGAWSAEDQGYTTERSIVHLQRALAAGSERFDWLGQRPDGSCFRCEVRAKRVARSGSVAAERGLVLLVVRDTSREQAAREAQRVAEERFRGITQNLPRSAIGLCDHQSRLLLLDGPELAVMGLSKDMEGKTVFEVFASPLAELAATNLSRALNGESFSMEVPVGDLWYACHYLPLRSETGAVLYAMAIAVNVTDERRALERVRSSEERFARIVETAPEPMSILREHDGVLTYVNPAFESSFGWPSAEAVGRTAVELQLWRDQEQRQTVREEFRRRRRVDSALIQVRLRSGELVDGLLSLRAIDIEGVPGILTTFRDISELRRAQRALEASEVRQRALAEATFEGIRITHDGVVVDTNEQLAAMYRTTRQDLLGRFFLELIAPASHATVLTHLEQGLAGACQYQAIRADGTTFPVEVRSRNVVLDGRGLRVAAIRDMTEHVRAQAERERLLRELQSRNAEMEQFTYTVSHDLKSPLVTISGFLGAIERDLSEGSQSRVPSDIARIRSAAGKMSALLDDLLKLSRVGRIGGPFGPVPIAEIALEAAELVAGALQAAHIQLDVADDHTLVYGDRGRLLQVFQNLIDNAAKYSAQRPQPRIEVGWSQEAEHWLVFVRDNGIGIAPEYAERIFGLFEKLDPKSSGTGVGLALVRRIIAFHGGRIWVESDGHEGSTFWFTLPRPPASQPVSPEDAAAQDNTGKQ